MIIEMPKAFQVKAKGTINYQYILVKANFDEDKWVVAAEMRPGNAKVVHHSARSCGRRDRTGWRRRSPGKPMKKGPRRWPAQWRARISWASTILG